MFKPKGLHLCCGGGRCPRVFVNKQGDFIVQGYQVNSYLKKQLNPLENEEVVLLPKDLVLDLYKNYQPD